MNSFPRIDPSDFQSRAYWKQRLDTEQFRVCVEKGTERPFSGLYTDEESSGVYHCVCCGAALFRSDAKFHSGCGWPSYFEPVSPQAMQEREDLSHGMRRVEVMCAGCGAHLGHVFPDGPPPTGLRYCINSVCLVLEEEE